MSTDFQIAPTTEPAPAPAPAPPAAPQQATTATGTKQARDLEHTPGGLPVIPLAVIASNSTIAGLSAVAVAAGPAAAAATAGSLLLGGIAAKAAGGRRTNRRPKPLTPRPRNQQRINNSGSGGSRQTPSSGGTRRQSVPSPRSSSALRATPHRSGGSSTNRGTTGLRRTTTPNKGGGTGVGGVNSPSPAKPSHRTRKQNAPKPSSRTQQIKQLRKDKAAAAPSRRERRIQDLGNRRGLRDGRRHDKRAARDWKKTNRNTGPHPGNGNQSAPKRTSPAGSKQRKTVTQPINLKKTGPATDTLRPTRTDKLRAKLRTARDQATDNRATRIQQARSKAKARAALTKNRGKAHARYGLQAATRALLAAPVGILGALTTPLGKQLGWAWLQYPGRRLYRRLTATGRYNRDARLADAANTYAHTTDQQHPLADTVARAPRNGHTPDLGDTDMSEDIKLHFLETSEETVSAARAYEPGGMLHVRQVIKAMPVALENWAQAFAVLAEKSDAEFPLGDEIGEGLDDIHQQMRQLIAHAEELAQTFDRIHENDIERLINPRKSREAEKTWDTTANEDYDAD